MWQVYANRCDDTLTVKARLPYFSYPTYMTSSPSKRPSGFKLISGFLVASLASGAIAAGMAAPAVGAAGVVGSSFSEAFTSLPADLNPEPLAARTTLLYSDGSVMATIFEQNRIEVPLEDMSINMQHAILAVEDYRFYNHKGVDPLGIFRAGISKFTSGDTQGASTLTQQWIKNVLLDRAVRAGDEVEKRRQSTADPVRKIREMRLALDAEQKFTKDQILQNYLNIAYFANRTYGVEAASRYYYNKSAKDLTVPEAAMLAGIVQNPVKWNPVKYPENAKMRRNVVMKRMLDVGYIKESDYLAWSQIEVPSMLDIQKIEAGCEMAEGDGFFCDYVTKVIIKDPHFKQFIKDNPDAGYFSPSDLLYRGGLKVRTTLDKRMQKIAYEKVNHFAGVDTSGEDVGMSLVSVEPGTGQIKTMVQNKKFKAKPTEDPHYSAVNFNTIFEYGGSRGFQPGSNMKPFVLAEWLKKGHTVKDFVTSTGTVLPFKAFRWKGVPLSEPQVWPVKNAGKVKTPMTVEEATYRSINGVYARMTAALDLHDIVETTKDLGVYRAAPVAARTAWRDQDPREIQGRPAFVLGSNEVAPMSIAGAYAAFGAEGVFCKPIGIASITDRNGKSIPTPSADCNQALPPKVANQMAETMQLVFTKGTARKTTDPEPEMNIGPFADGRPAAGKTGTTNNSVNTWFTGYTPDLSTSVWLGHIKSQKESMSGELVGGRRRKPTYGGTYTAPVWKRFMEEVYANAPIRFFTPPNESKVMPLVINDGKMPNVFDREVDQVREYFEKKGYVVEVGESAYSSAKEGHVAGTAPSPGNKLTTGQTITVFPSKGVRNVPQVPQPEPTETEGSVPDPTSTSTPDGTNPEEDPAVEGGGGEEQPAPTTTNAGEPQETDPGPTTTTDVTPTNVTKTTTTTDGPGVEGDAPEDGDAEGPEATTPQPTPTPTPNPAPTPTGLAPPEDN